MNYLENTKAALAEWQKVPVENVSLRDWRCGTLACFGGHLPTFDHFHALGVRASSCGAPWVPASLRTDGGAFPTYEEDEGCIEGMGPVSEYLFGVLGMFACRDAEPDDPITDWEIVNQRLLKRLVELDTQRQGLL